MIRVTDPHHVDHGSRLETNHACPDCPTPGVGDGPTPTCRYCAGTGLVDTQQLDRWQHDVDQAELRQLAT